MIQANELRIGNLVQTYTGDILKVETINKDSEGYVGYYISHENGRAAFKAHGFDVIVGIPLTEEWMLKFGFERKEDYANDGIGDILVSYKLDGYEFMQDVYGGWFLCGYNWNTEHFKYVHQLQNLYFALTGQELTI